MTAFDRLDPIDVRYTGGIEDLAAATRPDYLDDVFQVTSRSRQRPWWTFPERWLPMDTTMPVTAGRFRVPVLPLLMLLILAVVAAILVAYAGSQLRSAPPYGPARNGAIAFGAEDIYVQDSLDGAPRLLIGGPGQQQGAWFSPDGRLVAYDNVVDGVRTLWVANADGTNQHKIFDPDEDGGWLTWSGDSRHLALVGGVPVPSLKILSTDGTPPRVVDLGDLTPDRTTVWDPQVPGQLLVRALSPDGTVGLYFVRDDGTGLTQLSLPSSWPASPDQYGWHFSAQTFTDDGRHIAMNVATPAGVIGAGQFDPWHYRIGLVDRDGSHARLLPNTDGEGSHEAWPQFSPDGKWLATQRFAYGGTVSLVVRPADGSGDARVVIPPFVDDSNTMDVVWSPDGGKLIAWLRAPRVAWEIDPATGERMLRPALDDVPGWQRAAP